MPRKAMVDGGWLNGARLGYNSHPMGLGQYISIKI